MRFFSFIALFSSALTLPLNINLGAYSPALVVGDGEISFGAGGTGESAARSASEVLETLATGAAASAAANAGQTQPATGTEPAAGGQPAAGTEPTNTTNPGAGQTEPQTPTATESAASGDPQARAQIMKKVLQGAPPFKRDDILKRDIQGFRESLAFAKEAMKNTPELDIGTEKAGVGILQNPGINVPANSPAAGVPQGTAGGQAAAGKRSLEERSEKLGITLLAIAEI